MLVVFVMAVMLFSTVGTAFAADLPAPAQGVSTYSVSAPLKAIGYIVFAYDAQIAGGYLNGVSVSPGDKFDFNQIVGPFTEDRDYFFGTKQVMKTQTACM